MKQILRLSEKELPGVIHGYSLGGNAFLHLLDYLYQFPESILLSPWFTRIQIDRPIFIIGPYRSGTTILAEIIASHPSVGFFSYLTNVFNHSPVLSYLTTRLFFKIGLLDLELISPIHNPAVPTNLLSPFECESLWMPTRKSLWDDTCTDMRLDAGFSDPKFERNLRRLIQGHLIVLKATRFLNKNPINSLRIAYLHKLFPGARFIHITRDPLETIISHYRTAGRVEAAFNADPKIQRIFRENLHIDMLSQRIRVNGSDRTQCLNREHPLLGIANQWVEMLQAIRESIAPDPSIALLDIRYEELVDQPEVTLDQIWEFNDLTGKMATRISAKYSKRLNRRTAVGLTVEERKYLHPIREIISPTAALFGYEIK